MTISDAVSACVDSGLSGWDLVCFAQSVVNKTMTYSYTNSYDMPSFAFRKGRGYCWQQAKALMLILRRLGFNCHMVFAAKNTFPSKTYNGKIIPAHVSGHVWCRVKIDSFEKDVCPGDAENIPGKLHFTPVSRVMRWNVFISWGCYFASAQVNKKRYQELMAKA